MKLHNLKMHRFGLFALACALAPIVYADSLPTVSMYSKASTYQPGDRFYSYAGEYVTPYTAQVTSPTSYSATVICDDLMKTVGVGQPDRTYVVRDRSQLAIANTVPLHWAATKYQLAANLAALLLDVTQTSAISAARGQLAFAIWAVFDPGNVDAQLAKYYSSNPIGLASLANDRNAISGYLSQTFTRNVDFQVWTPCTVNTSGSCASGLNGQEFIVVNQGVYTPVKTPEAPMLGLLCLNLTGLLGLMFVFRRHLVRG